MSNESIQLVINGESINLHSGCTLPEFLESKSLNLAQVVVERNSEALSKTEASNTTLEDNDVLEIVRIVAGG